jgi:hypothetical protein
VSGQFQQLAVAHAQLSAHQPTDPQRPSTRLDCWIGNVLAHHVEVTHRRYFRVEAGPREALYARRGWREGKERFAAEPHAAQSPRKRMQKDRVGGEQHRPTAQRRRPQHPPSRRTHRYGSGIRRQAGPQCQPPRREEREQ